MRALDHLAGALAPTGASTDAVAQVEDALGLVLPGSYKDFMAASDGCDGPLPHIWVILYPIGLVVPQSQSYRELCHAPGAVFIGTDGAGEAYLIDYGRDEPLFGAMAYVGGSLDDLWYTAATFDEFVDRLARA